VAADISRTAAALVDLVAGDEVAGVRVGDQQVGLGRGDQLGRGADDRGGGVRVCGRDLGERREQRAHGRGILLAGLLEPGPAPVSASAARAASAARSTGERRR
jgi:hypothetical protein